MRLARTLSCLLMAAAFSCVSALQAQTSAPLDPAKRADQVAPTPESADTPLSPGRTSNQRPFFRNEYLQDQRYRTPDLVERKEFVSQDRRAPIDVAETRDKNVIERKEFPRKPEVKEHVQNRHDGEKARIQPKDDQIKRYDTVSKYQDRITDAKTAAAQRAPTIEKRTTFEKLNRFIFKRNGPGTEGGQPTVTPAGGTPPPSQDTYTKYRVEWKRFEPAKATNVAPSVPAQ